MDGSYERTEADNAAARAFQRAIRQDGELRDQFGAFPPRNIEARISRESRTWQTGAAFLSELSGKGLVIYELRSENAPNGVTVPQISGTVFVSNATPSIPATVGHEAWHRLMLDNPTDAALIGALK